MAGLAARGVDGIVTRGVWIGVDGGKTRGEARVVSRGVVGGVAIIRIAARVARGVAGRIAKGMD